ncbi:DEAD/DEAH box helicase [Desulfoprunum benzoelyticum]|uniref:DEAD/DEAH box helicase domain-containing protein n=1 Tax=Desulfoprunum benzoelyticum TaxID=1506996 RepID=A0A840UJI2_9BACT|nr:DEAD/DEAH box helicase [Desulfoprunum benzoelyticum]MBB5346497.1 DEAD/DEAH box helicase domain-containing protein [Desulfoprunum benzoelyticum]MBM9528974.1 DEAD/DEAH box helicase [Desulfoprunum benzoelyticum]
MSASHDPVAGTGSIVEYLAALESSRKFGPQVVCHRVFPATAQRLAAADPALSPATLELLRTRGIDRLYTHQAEAIGHLLAGNHVVVATPTASGKSMIFNLPVLDGIGAGSGDHALYLYPLKALAQDQLRVVEDLAGQLRVGPADSGGEIAAIYDGDSSSYQRRRIRDHLPPILMTNPDMLHLSILPYHGNWSTLFKGLRYVVIDEIHTYRGVFGSHMAWVIRRLKRIAENYGAAPRFVLLSATIGNAGAFARQLIDAEVEAVSVSGAPQAEKHFLFLNPWDNAATIASQLLEAALKRGLRTIVYTKSRRMTELIHLWTAPRLGPLQGKLSSYRAGFLPEERREIEQRLNCGSLLGVVSTSALELGIDIGDLDLCILVGYPGSIMASWQRGGRVGRQQRTSAIIMIAQEDALDQHFMRQPEDFFSRAPESAVVNPLNESILHRHLHCAAAELPLAAAEPLLQNPDVTAAVDALVRSATLLQDADGRFWHASRKYPQRHVNLRGGGLQLALINCDSGEIFGEVDSGRALKECHPGAVYIHRATSWLVEDLDLVAREVTCRRQTPPYYTRPISGKETEILQVLDQKTAFGCRVSFGRLKVTEKVTGYQRLNNATRRVIATMPLDLPEQIIETEGLWLEIAEDLQRRLETRQLHFMGAIHALEHAMISLFPLLVLCDRNDIGGISCPRHPQTPWAAVFIYDGHDGGIGLAAEAYRNIDELLTQTERTIRLCSCDNGCPSCVHSPKCGSGNRPIDKGACRALLEMILAGNQLQASVKSLAAPEARAGDEPVAAENVGAVGRSSGERLGIGALPRHYGVFDLETIRSAAEVGGWNRCERMGISVAVVWDSVLGECVTYLEHEIDGLVEHLFALDLVVGFNSRRFDYRVLNGYSPRDFSRLPTLDLLEEVSNHLGYRLSLDRLAEHTLGEKKSADGLQALKWYREGRIDLIAQYCRKDVEITRDLLHFALEKGYLLFQNKAAKTVRLPLALEKIIGAESAKGDQGQISG